MIYVLPPHITASFPTAPAQKEYYSIMFWGSISGQQVGVVQPPPPGGKGAIATVIRDMIELPYTSS